MDSKNYKGCLMLNYQFDNWDKVLSYIDKNDLSEGDGYEYTPHVTILYGLEDNQDTPFEVGEFLNDINIKFSNLILKNLKIGFFENDEFDVIKLDVSNEEINELNELFTKNFNYKNDYPNYEAHMTIAYLKKGLIDKYKKLIFPKNIKIYPKEFVYSDSDHNKTYFGIKKLGEDNNLKEDKITNSFILKDKLNSTIFDDKDKMRPEVRNKLTLIGNLFYDSLKIDKKLNKIYLIGSCANYNYSEYSDIDLFVDLDNFKNSDMIDDYIFTKRELWRTYDYKIGKYPVELYAGKVSSNKTNGIYSITDNKWVKKPNKDGDIVIEHDLIIKKANYFIKDIEKLIKNKEKIDIKKIETIYNKLREYRNLGLNKKEGEFSFENLVYKYIRRKGYIDKIEKINKKII